MGTSGMFFFPNNVSNNHCSLPSSMLEELLSRAALS
jgi:hypothetical protein